MFVRQCGENYISLIAKVYPSYRRHEMVCKYNLLSINFHSGDDVILSDLHGLIIEACCAVYRPVFVDHVSRWLIDYDSRCSIYYHFLVVVRDSSSDVKQNNEININGMTRLVISTLNEHKT